MKKWWTLLTPAISAVIGLIVIDKWNVFTYFTVVPENMAYEVGITVYFASANAILEILKEFVKKHTKEFFSEIEVVISPPQMEATIESIPIIKFNDMGQAQAEIIVKIRGFKKHFQGSYVEIPSVSFATVQPTFRSKEVKINEMGVYRIDLEQLFARDNKTNTKVSFRIVMAQETVDGDREVILEPKIFKKKLRVQYKHNKARLKAEDFK